MYVYTYTYIQYIYIYIYIIRNRLLGFLGTCSREWCSACWIVRRSWPLELRQSLSCLANFRQSEARCSKLMSFI